MGGWQESLFYGLCIFFAVGAGISFVLLILAFFIWGLGGHAKDTTQEDIREMKNILIKISRRLGVSRYGRKLR